MFTEIHDCFKSLPSVQQTTLLRLPPSSPRPSRGNPSSPRTLLLPSFDSGPARLVRLRPIARTRLSSRGRTVQIKRERVRETRCESDDAKRGRRREITFSIVVIFLSLGAAEAVSKAEVRRFLGGARAGGGGGGAEGLDVVAEEVVERETEARELGDEFEMIGWDGMVAGLEVVELAKKA